jgi:CO/xanthine dehydrogenase Mo-binding subunit
MSAHRFPITRRQFLQAGGALVVGFSLAGPIAEALGKEGAAAPKDFKKIDAWLGIGRDGRVTVYSGHVELGTGVETALSQMVADELDVSFESIRIVQGDTLLTPDQGPTWGSLSVQAAGLQLRKAAACARRALLERAAERLGMPATDLEVEDGVVFSGAKRVGYVALASRAGALDVPFDDKVELKRPEAFKMIGRPIRRVDIPGKVTGEFTYMQDFRLRGMLHGRVVRPSAIGARLEGVDDAEARKVPGFVRTVVEGDFVGVLARTEWAAIKASGALKCNWSGWAGLPAMDRIYDSAKELPVKQTATMMKEGDAAGALKAAAKTIKARYEYPVQTHGSIGPSCSVADVRADRAVIWSASQSPHWTQREIARMLGFKPEQVRIVYLEGAGCYGRNGHEDASADAVLMSRAAGRPVRVQWMRADEHGWDPKSPPYVAELEGALDASGNVAAWSFVTWLPFHLEGLAAEVPLLAQSLKERTAGVQVAERMNAGNMQNNAKPPYSVPNVLSAIHWLETTTFRPSWLRGPGRMQNTYANECFMDELAVAAGADPIEFRLRHLKDERGAACIKACAERAGWDRRPSPRKNANGGMLNGRGFSYVFYDNNRTYVSAMCEVEVDPGTGRVRAERFVIAHDCGLIVNPDGLKAQIEGSVVQTLSRSLIEECKWDSSHITSLDWQSYPILTFPDVPRIEVVLIDRPDKPAWGAGEPTCAVVPSALANAIYDATGARVRTAPFTPKRVKAALPA